MADSTRLTLNVVRHKTLRVLPVWGIVHAFSMLSEHLASIQGGKESGIVTLKTEDETFVTGVQVVDGIPYLLTEAPK